MPQRLHQRVTVLMPVYNGMPFLPEAVDSILNQTLEDIICLIIDDDSTDGSKEYLNSLDDVRVRIIHLKNKGLGASLNIGVNHCETEFLARMDADDIIPRKRLETQLAYLSTHEDVGLLGTQIAYIGKSGRSGFPSSLPLKHEAIYQKLITGQHAVCHPTIMCRTRVLKAIGGYRFDGIGEDWDMFLRMGEVTRLANLPQVLLLYRTHENSVTLARLRESRKRVGFACHCAKLRGKNQAEITFDEFLIRENKRHFWQYAAEVMDLYALGQYRRALGEILDSSRAVGYTRISWSALCSPIRTYQRIRASARRRSRLYA